ncbi:MULTISPECIES: adenylate/guanylate cyclase domain-containing protein [unclassified Treponema]|uniref:adenylate/guanylate cyclase domain-containing protein n=1 Tax=unclassified Treponema TaxID=2638727 RepID=UPI0020A43001|nr:MULTISPECIES: adenylate/guanylate cyclase domain-containing protein [unclassified Treponema]UTC66878.1 adenylate/guanylate cyclase domain-containing protein [Treponema sp. OMZ 789]UTC69607.1 adenylate/guanylate cyclase domain-containing protein [Treponema sp. OMZ 790]UTC72321.1 adenylate/guanylate cyclase domain-containing protein [Treponema sp. OMZ 791]
MTTEKKRLFLGSIPFCFLIIILYLTNLVTPIYKQKIVDLEVIKGRAQVPNQNQASPVLFSLKGDFYYTPNQFYCLKNTTEEVYAKVPGDFTNRKKGSAFGYGSYGLELSGLDPSVVYAIHVPHIFGSCSIVINGIDRERQGQPGTNKETEIPGTTSSQIAFKPLKDGTTNIIINVSNFFNKRGYISSPIILGEASQIGAMFRGDLIFYGTIFAITFSVALFFFMLSFFYEHSSFVIWFALTSMVLAVRGVFFYPHIFMILFPGIPWQINFIIRYITFPLPIILFTVFISKALKLKFKLPYIIILSVSILYTISTIIIPPEISTFLLIYYQIFAVFCVGYIIIVAIIGLRKNKEFAIWIFISTSVLFLCGIYDLFVALDLIPGEFIVQIGTVVSVTILSIMVLNDYADSMKKIEELSVEMQLINKSLIRFVPDQIVELLHKKSITDVKLGDNVELTMPILSIDIRSFTHTSEKLTPNQVFELLNEYFALVAPIVREYKGVITKYLGDGFFALFPDGADSALSCGVAIQKTLRNNSIAVLNSSPLRIGIGIDMGDILLGTIGNSSRMDSIIISNSYHVAEVLQESTKKYSSCIIISDKIYEALNDTSGHYIRPIQRVKNSSNKETFLYEVYDCDDDFIRDLKHSTQSYMENALKALSNEGIESAAKYFDKVLGIFPNDYVALYYKKIFEKISTR